MTSKMKGKAMRQENYLLVYWWIDNAGDYKPTFETDFEFIKSKELDDIRGLMKKHGVKRWVQDPHSVTIETWKNGDASLVEYRNVSVRPIKVVESWAYSSERVNEL